MFELVKLKRAIEIQERSYALLRWLVRGRDAFEGTSHPDLELAAAAEDWLRRHYLNLPADAQPAYADLPDFAKFFCSYLQTSFVKVRRKISYCGCYCDWCSYFGSTLQARSPGEKACAVAYGLKRIFVRSLAQELRLPYLDGDFDAVLKDEKIALVRTDRSCCVVWNSQARAKAYWCSGARLPGTARARSASASSWIRVLLWKQKRR